jgi:DNA-binding MltR family transcriptional regulator
MSKYDDALFGLRVPDLVRQDAGHAIIAHALVDQMLGTLILAYLPKKLSDSDAQMLLSRRGPFSSLQAKTKFASALELIGDETRKDLEGINAVRNAFAHPKGFLRFASPEVAAVLENHWPTTDGAQALFDERVERVAEAMKAKFDSLIYENSVRP